MSNSSSNFGGSAYTAKTLAGLFADGKIVAGSGTLTTVDAAIAVAHGLGSTPDFVIAMSSLAVGSGAASGKFGWTASSTSITFTKADTGAIETFSYIAGVLA